MLSWWNGIHSTLKTSRRKDCEFESHREYHAVDGQPCERRLEQAIYPDIGQVTG
jgi:hypothetical protein